MLIDTHAHLNSNDYNEDFEETINRAIENDVKKIIVVGFDEKTNELAIELANKYSFIYASVGLHPTEVTNNNDYIFSLIEKQLVNKKVVAIGECGLDYYWKKETKDIQIAAFKKQIELSLKYDLPLIIHNRDASLDTLNTLRSFNCKLKGVMHAYSASKEMLKDFLDLGLNISIGGVVTFKNAITIKEVASIVPLEKLLLETDCPYLTPSPYRGKRNEPAYVKYICEEISKIRNISYEELSKATSENAIKLFNMEG